MVKEQRAQLRQFSGIREALSSARREGEATRDTLAAASAEAERQRHRAEAAEAAAREARAAAAKAQAAADPAQLAALRGEAERLADAVRVKEAMLDSANDTIARLKARGGGEKGKQALSQRQLSPFFP